MLTRREVLVSALAASVTPWASPSFAQQAKAGGHLTAAVVLETASLDPIFGNAPGPSDRNIYNLYVENLVYHAADGSFQPMLAESWELAADGKSVTFKIRPGVKFSDDTPLDAEAVKFNLDRVMDPQVDARARQFTGDFESTDVIDEMTVRLNLKQPSGPILAILAEEAGSIVSPTAVKERGEDFARNPVGTGPFVIKSWSSGVVEAERFDGYWGEKALLDQITVRVINNTAVKIVEAKAGSVQLADAIQVKDFAEVEGDENLALLDMPLAITAYMVFNNQRSPFKENAELRKALALSLNREAIKKAVSGDLGGVLTAFEPPQAWDWDESLTGHKYDPDAAREAYEKSGFTGQLSMLCIQRDPDTLIAQLAQSMFKQAGIDVKIEVIERSAWVPKILAYDYDISLVRAQAPLSDPDLIFSTFFGRSAAQDFAGIRNPEIWDLVDKARSLSDQAERKKIYVDIQQKILDNYWQTYMSWRPQRDIARRSLMGFEREYCGAWRYNKMWLDA